MRSDALRRRESLLRAARRLFATRGRDVPLETVAEEAGVGIATLYRNFASREELVYAVTLSLLEDLSRAAAETTRTLESAAGVRAVADRAWRGFVGELASLQLGALAQALAVKATSHLAPDVLEVQQSAVAEVERALVHLRAHGLVREDVGALDVVLGLGLVTRPLPEVIRTSAPGLTDRIVDLLVAGMAPNAMRP